MSSKRTDEVYGNVSGDMCTLLKTEGRCIIYRKFRVEETSGRD